MNLQPSIKRFILGATIGLLFAAVGWSYSAYCNVPVSLLQGTIGSLVLAISLGIIASIGDIDELIDNLPFL